MTTTSRVLPAENDYADLKRRIKSAGLLEKEPGYYIFKFSLTFGLFLMGVLLLFVVDNFLFQLAIAIYLGFVSSQIGFLGHDLGHRQVFEDARDNDRVGMLVGPLMLGMSRFWWVEKHNAHHSNPNQEDMDPDIDIPILAFTEEQALEKRGLLRAIVKYQGYFLLPITSLQVLGMHKISVVTLLTKKPREWQLELLCIALHFVWLFGLLLLVMPWWQAILFVLVMKAVGGVYNSSVFAPNHKGMPILPKDTPLDFFRRQVLTARNIVAHPFTDFWYGGLNYQIEHHLFPSMPRNRLRESQAIVKEFCAERGVDYYETSILQSYREIFEYLDEISLVLRPGKAQAAA
jgi:fatty acid desaturase